MVEICTFSAPQFSLASRNHAALSLDTGREAEEGSTPKKTHLEPVLLSRSREEPKLLAAAGAVIKFRLRPLLQVRHGNLIPYFYLPREDFMNKKNLLLSHLSNL